MNNNAFFEFKRSHSNIDKTLINFNKNAKMAYELQERSKIREMVAQKKPKNKKEN